MTEQNSPHPHDIPEDLNGKASVEGYQKEFLEGVSAAIALGIPPDNSDPVEMILGENATSEDFDRMWAEAGQ